MRGDHGRSTGVLPVDVRVLRRVGLHRAGARPNTPLEPDQPRGLHEARLRTPKVRDITGTTTLVGILGWPVSHSLSPAMHNAAFEALGLDWAYIPLPTPPERLPDAVHGLVATGFAGANVTIPHKTAVIAVCDVVDDDARHADSVNTLVFRDGRV